MAKAIELNQDSTEPDIRYVEQLYSLYWNYVCKYLNSRYGGSGVDTDDVAQEAFAKLLSLPDLRNIKNPRAYLMATARNMVLDGFRKSNVRLAYARKVADSDDQYLNDDLLPENVLFGSQKVRVVQNTIAAMPELERKVLLLHRMEDKTYGQIAKKFGISETTVRRHIARAIARIHTALKRAYGESI